VSALPFNRGEAVPADPAERLRGIAARMRHLSRTIRAARDPHARYTGEDATGMVVVTADSSGQVLSVDIGRQWFSRHGTASLGPAILEAHQAAISRLLVEQADRLDRAGDETPDPRPAELSSTAVPSADRPAPTVAELDDLLRAVAEAEHRQSVRRQTPAVPAQRRVHGPAGHISLLVHGHAVQKVSVGTHIDSGLLAALARDAVAAFREAADPVSDRPSGGEHATERQHDARQ